MNLKTVIQLLVVSGIMTYSERDRAVSMLYLNDTIKKSETWELYKTLKDDSLFRIHNSDTFARNHTMKSLKLVKSIY